MQQKLEIESLQRVVANRDVDHSTRFPELDQPPIHNLGSLLQFHCYIDAVLFQSLFDPLVRPPSPDGFALRAREGAERRVEAKEIVAVFEDESHGGGDGAQESVGGLVLEERDEVSVEK